MLDFEENKRQLEQLQTKLKELGESLWHTKPKDRISTIRRKNKSGKFLGRYDKFYQSLKRNESIKK